MPAMQPIGVPRAPKEMATALSLSPNHLYAVLLIPLVITGLASAIKIYGTSRRVKLFKLKTQKYRNHDPSIVSIAAALKDRERPNFSIAYTLGICIMIAEIRKMETQLFTMVIFIS